MTNSRNEYRINKNGAECFRTKNGEAAYQKLHELQRKHPGVYTMQYRACLLDRYGSLLTDLSGNPLWSSWH